MDLRIYMANGFAILFSLMEEVNVVLQFIVLILTGIYTLVSIYRKVK